MAEHARRDAQEPDDHLKMHLRTYAGFTRFTLVSTATLATLLVSLAIGALSYNWGVAAFGLLVTPFIAYLAYRDPHASLWPFPVLILVLLFLHLVFR